MNPLRSAILNVVHDSTLKPAAFACQLVSSYFLAEMLTSRLAKPCGVLTC